jgi:hypothetical protein
MSFTKQLMTILSSTIPRLHVKVKVRGLDIECPIFDDLVYLSFIVLIAEKIMESKVKQKMDEYEKKEIEDQEKGMPGLQREWLELCREAVDSAIKTKAKAYYKGIGRIVFHCLSQGFTLPSQCIHPILIQGM